MEKKRYFNEINLMRGFAMLCVVFIHSTPYDSFHIPDNIYLFMEFCIMSLFFALSGFVNTEKFCGNKDFSKQAVKQIRTIFIPYFIYSLIAFVLKAVTNSLEGTSLFGIFIGETPCVVLWFLWVLFVANLLSLFIGFCFEKLKLKNREMLFFCIGIIAFFANRIFEFGIFSNVFGYLPYLYLGIFLRRYYDVYKKIISKWYVAVPSILAFVALLVLGIETHVVFQVVSITAVWIVFLFLAERFYQSKVYRLFDSLGKHSFNIYLWSYFVQVAVRIVAVNILSLGGMASFMMIFLCGLIIPYVASIVLGRFNIRLR